MISFFNGQKVIQTVQDPHVLEPVGTVGTVVSEFFYPDSNVTNLYIDTPKRKMIASSSKYWTPLPNSNSNNNLFSW